MLENQRVKFLPDQRIYKTTANLDQTQRMVHSYKNAITGFAAKLTAEEAKELATLDGV
ncbi:hypothetical protein NL676_011361, partial [Syzygium grande]